MPAISGRNPAFDTSSVSILQQQDGFCCFDTMHAPHATLRTLSLVDDNDTPSYHDDYCCKLGAL